MRKSRISERDAQAIMSGHTPASRPDLAPLADSIAEFRAAAFESPVQPSAALTVRLGLLGESQLLSHNESQPGTGESRKRVTMFSWIAGLGIIAKIALAAGVAVAATTGAGAAGVLPASAQVAFDQVVSTVVAPSVSTTESGSTDVAPEPSPSSTNHPDNFGSEVSTGAKDPNKVGRTFGQETSEAAHAKNTTDVSTEADTDGDNGVKVETDVHTDTSVGVDVGKTGDSDSSGVHEKSGNN